MSRTAPTASTGGTPRAEMIQDLFVGGEWVSSTASEKTFEVTNPANGKTIAALPDAGGEDVQRAIDLVTAAQKEWADTTAGYRAAILREAARLMHEHKEHLARVMTLVSGDILSGVQRDTLIGANVESNDV